MKILSILLTLITFNALAFRGRFVIPTENEPLKFYSTFYIQDIDIDPDHLKFTVPPELASDQAYRLKFERNSEGANVLQSYFGTAHCLQMDPKVIKCEVNFNRIYQKALIKSLYKTMDYIQRSTNNIDDLTSLLLVAEAFSGKPQGTLFIEIDTI